MPERHGLYAPNVQIPQVRKRYNWLQEMQRGAVFPGIPPISGDHAVEIVLVGVLDADLREVAVFGVFLLILILRPSGLFGKSLNLSHVSP